MQDRHHPLSASLLNCFLLDVLIVQWKTKFKNTWSDNCNLSLFIEECYWKNCIQPKTNLNLRHIVWCLTYSCNLLSKYANLHVRTEFSIGEQAEVYTSESSMRSKQRLYIIQRRLIEVPTRYFLLVHTSIVGMKMKHCHRCRLLQMPIGVGMLEKIQYCTSQTEEAKSVGK
mgnify:CR=1 FL=1